MNSIYNNKHIGGNQKPCEQPYCPNWQSDEEISVNSPKNQLINISTRE